MKLIIFLFIFSFSTNLNAQPWTKHGRLKVNPHNPHYLIHEDGTEFFYLGDTGWLLFHRLNRQEVEIYLKNRAENEFNVIQAVAIMEIDGLNNPNYYGDTPINFYDHSILNITEGNNPDNSEEYDYWDHVDFIISKAEEYGLYVGLLPCWGEYVIPRVYEPFFRNTQETYDFGFNVGRRYSKKENIIWILGGDREPDEREGGIELWSSMAEGITDGVNNEYDYDNKADYNSTLITHHSYGSSSNWFHNKEWIDFHTYGSYHSDYSSDRSYLLASIDWNLKDPKPTLNSEPAYEMHPLNWIEENGIFYSYDVRQIAYWSVFSGAAGHTYGAHPIWQFYDMKHPQITNVTNNWQSSLNLPGTIQMKYLKRLMLSNSMEKLRPDQSILLGQNKEGNHYATALKSDNYCYIYLPTGYPVEVNLDDFRSDNICAKWLNPRNGEFLEIGLFKKGAREIFDPPGVSKELEWLQTGRGCDWVLVLEGKIN